MFQILIIKVESRRNLKSTKHTFSLTLDFMKTMQLSKTTGIGLHCSTA